MQFPFKCSGELGPKGTPLHSHNFPLEALQTHQSGLPTPWPRGNLAYKVKFHQRRCQRLSQSDTQSPTQGREAGRKLSDHVLSHIPVSLRQSECAQGGACSTPFSSRKWWSSEDVHWDPIQLPYSTSEARKHLRAFLRALKPCHQMSLYFLCPLISSLAILHLSFRLASSHPVALPHQLQLYSDDNEKEF